MVQTPGCCRQEAFKELRCAGSTLKSDCLNTQSHANTGAYTYACAHPRANTTNSPCLSQCQVTKQNRLEMLSLIFISMDHWQVAEGERHWTKCLQPGCSRVNCSHDFPRPPAWFCVFAPWLSWQLGAALVNLFGKMCKSRYVKGLIQHRDTNGIFYQLGSQNKNCRTANLEAPRIPQPVIEVTCMLFLSKVREIAGMNQNITRWQLQLAVMVVSVADAHHARGSSALPSGALQL